MFFNTSCSNFVENIIFIDMRNIYQKVSWRKYLIPNQREWITEYMEHHGEDFYTRAVDMINEAWKYNRSSFILAKLIRTNICVYIDQSEYELAMKYCMNWFERNEHYEYCAIVRDYLLERKGRFKKRSFKEELASLIS